MKCDPVKISINKCFRKRGTYDEEPEYQRQGGAWSRAKQQLFLHSLFCNYDVPKIYLHELPKNSRHEYAIVDGKQRLQCIWDFMDNKIALGEQDYTPSDADMKRNKPYPKTGDKFSDLTEDWRDEFRGIELVFSVIKDADMDDIEEIFSRLNYGEPLKGAELRNAKGGKMNELIRELAEHKFFRKVMPVPDKNYRYRDFAARFLLIENALISGGGNPYRDLKKIFLDRLVENNKRMSPGNMGKHRDSVNKQLNVLCKIFGNKDPLLKRIIYIQLYYLFAKAMEKDYAGKDLLINIKKFLPAFRQKVDNAAKFSKGPEEELDEDALRINKFLRQISQPNDANSLKRRVSTMRYFFLQEYPKTKLRDNRRYFSEEERLILYLNSGGKCTKCEKPFNTFEDVAADHILQWAHGGSTSIENGRALCKTCNAILAQKLAA